MNTGDPNLYANPYSWNNFSNMLYIESPGGVGYSTCEGKECIFDDNNSAEDNLAAILYFFESLFPEFLSNDLYISGESYAGIYVPYVSYQIDQHNNQVAKSGKGTQINLKGYMVGNGCTNWDVDTTPAYVEMGFWHGLYGTDLYSTIKDHECEY